MLKRLAAFAGAAVALSAMTITLQAGPALAHEARTIGAYDVEVGWGEEPAYAGIKNSVQLILATTSGKPVNDLGDSLKLDVEFANQKITLPLVLNFDPDSGEGSPGDYRAWLIPTAAGDYTFHFTGSIGSQQVDESFTSSPTTFDPDSGEGSPGDYRAWLIPTAAGDYTFHFTGSIGSQQVDESFTSSPATFDPVADPSSVQFPVKEPPVSQVAQLAQRLSTRLEAAGAAQVRTQDSAKSAKTIGYVGMAVGAVGILLAVAAMAMARRRSQGLAPGRSPGTAVERS